jgi:phospholipid/cholesterol/gamma-HCH transport system permease protein
MIPFMSWLTDFLIRRGAAALSMWRTWRGIFRFAGQALTATLTPAAYNSATRMVVMKQIYFTAWQILLPFTLFAGLLSYVVIQIVVSTAAQYGLSEYALEMSMRVLVPEVLPLVTALFVALRSSSAINTEVALMRIHNEIDALEAAGVDTLRMEFMPRVIGGVVSVVALTAITSVLALALAYIALYGFQLWSLPDFTRVMGKVFDLTIMVGVWVKCVAFGLAVTVIPVAEGLATPKMLFMAPISVLRGMVRLFFVLMFIEVASLALKYL